MKLSMLIAAAVVVLGFASHAARAQSLSPEVRAYLEERAGEFEQIPPERRAALERIARMVRARNADGDTARLLFVCTHNSRRSHMSQLWAQAGAAYFGHDVQTYSGGTESTAFNPRAVVAIERAGFDVLKTTDDSNPIYHVSMGEGLMPMTCFSKAYMNGPNPKSGFGAVMVCSDADEACPIVVGAAARFSVPYVDPKVSDNTPREAATYDERCAQIAREMLYAMSRVDG
ncbi:MAG: protein-tyrosine-phosphatase [Planctomycetota bacterium]